MINLFKNNVTLNTTTKVLNSFVASRCSFVLEQNSLFSTSSIFNFSGPQKIKNYSTIEKSSKKLPKTWIHKDINLSDESNYIDLNTIQKYLHSLDKNIDDESYYKITDSFQANSILENGDLINILENNVYLKLEVVLLFVLFLTLYGVFAISIITIISKYGSTLDNYFKNKYILMYLNLNKKYLNIFLWFWIFYLYFSIILMLIITYALIDNFTNYCIVSEVVSSCLLFKFLKLQPNKRFNFKKSKPLQESSINLY
jgi:hypothetical protein